MLSVTARSEETVAIATEGSWAATEDERFGGGRGVAHFVCWCYWCLGLGFCCCCCVGWFKFKGVVWVSFIDTKGSVG